MQATAAALAPHAQPLDAELDEAAAEWRSQQEAKLATGGAGQLDLEPELLQKYAISADDDAFAARLGGGVPTGAVKVLHAIFWGNNIRCSAKMTCCSTPFRVQSSSGTAHNPHIGAFHSQCCAFCSETQLL